MLHAAGNAHLVTHGTDDVVTAQQGEEIAERPAKRPHLMAVHGHGPSYQSVHDPLPVGCGLSVSRFIHGEDPAGMGGLMSMTFFTK